MKRELMNHYYEIGEPVFQIKPHQFEYLLKVMSRFRNTDGSMKHPNDIEQEIMNMVQDKCIIILQSDGFTSTNSSVNIELAKVNRFPFTWCHLIKVINEFPDLIEQFKSGNMKVKNVIIGKTMERSNRRVYADEVMWYLQEYMRCW